MKLIVGLGNPEQKYNGTRHNVGFWAVEQYLKAAPMDGLSTIANLSKFNSELFTLSKNNKKIIFVKPKTYYNLVGESVQAVAHFYKIAPEDVLIIHDDLALDFGTIRSRVGGSSAGNNGLKSISSHLGSSSDETARLRIGIANDQRQVLGDANFVLAKFSAEENTILTQNWPTIHGFIDNFISGDFPVTTHKK